MTTNLLENGRLGKPLTDYDVIDFHAHLSRWSFAIPDLSADGLVRTMDRLGVKASLCSSMECMSFHTQAGNDTVLEAMRAFPGRILGYLVLWPADAETVRTETERRLAEGFTGIKLHIENGFDYTCPDYAPAFEIANERRVPVLMHTYGAQRGLEQIPELAERYEHANFVLAHAGVGTVEEYIRLAKDYENVHLDLCASMCPAGVVERLSAGAPTEKILWGSDAIFLNMPQQLGKVLGAELSEETKKQILSTNAKRLLSQIRQG